MPIGRRPEPIPESSDSNQAVEEPLADEQRSIGERVQFWEEQDKINQVLIDRVVRQNDLLCDHIKDHESLPAQAETAVRSALAEARREQREQYRGLVEQMSASFADATRRALAVERDAMNKEYKAALTASEERWLVESRRQRKVLLWLIGTIAAVSVALSITAIILTLDII